MTITVTNGGSAASSIAGNTSNATSGQGGGANSLFALLFADAQLSNDQGAIALIDIETHPAHLQALSDSKISPDVARDALLFAQQNARLAASKHEDEPTLSEPTALVEELLSQIKGLGSDSKDLAAQSEDIPSESTPLLAALDPSLLAKAPQQATTKVEPDTTTVSDALSSKKGQGNPLLTLTTNEVNKSAGDETLKNIASEKNNGTEFSQQLSQALNGPRRPEGEIAQAKPIEAHVHDQHAWPKQLGDRVVWMTQQGQQTAEIHLNPAQLGPLQITLNLSQENATAVFVSQHAEVRQALQDALPQLREMLASSGINLGQANVSDQGPKEQQNTNQHTAHLRTERDPAILTDGTQTGLNHRVTPIHRDNGSIDLFA